MRVRVDRTRCLGTGGCEALAPEVFEVADDGVVAVLVDRVGPAEEEAVRDAVDSCPTLALSLEG
jgi:ferredoxin